MAHQETLYPLEFSIGRTPLSSQASAGSKQRWKETVALAAREQIRETDPLGFLDKRPVAVTIFYFAPEPMQGDVDNIVKPIVDALIGQAYLDDRQVERILVQKFEPLSVWELSAPTATLAEAMDGEPPVVYIRVDDDLAWRTQQ